MTDFDTALARMDPHAHARLVQLEKDLAWDPKEAPGDPGRAEAAPPGERPEDGALPAIPPPGEPTADGARVDEHPTTVRSRDGARPVIPPMESIREWLSAERIQARAEARFEGPLHGIEALRNILTLSPLILTWYSLSAAAYNFGYLASRNLVASEKSFLTLWQSGFDGKAQIPIPTFSEVARVDVTLFVSLVTVTLLYQLAVWWVTKQAHGLGNLANERLAELAPRVEAWRADDAQRRMRDALVSALGGTADSFAGLLTDVQDQRTRLEKMANNQSEGLAKLAETATAMQAGAERFAAHTEKMQELATAIEHSSTPLATAAESLTGLRSEITGATSNLATQSGDLADAVAKFLAEHDATREGIGKLESALVRHGAEATTRFDQVEAAADARRIEAEERRAEAAGYFARLEEEAERRRTDLNTMIDAFLNQTNAIRREAAALEEAHLRRVADLNQMLTDALADLSPALREQIVKPLLGTSLVTEGANQLATLNGGVMRLERSMHAIAMLLAEMMRGLAGEDGVVIGERPGAYVDGD